MIQSHIEHVEMHGSVNWDIPIARCLAILTMAATAGRAGDITKVNGYSSEYSLQYRHIRFCFREDAGDHPTFGDPIAYVTLEYEKGHKMERNAERTVPVLPLTESTHQHMSWISMLIVHVLRHGLVEATNLSELLLLTAAAPERITPWKFPNRPVIPAFPRNRNSRCIPDEPSNPHSLNYTIKLMAVHSNILTEVTTHAVRRGMAQDISRLPSTGRISHLEVGMGSWS